MSLDLIRPELIPFLAPYLPDSNSKQVDETGIPFVTLTYAQSLDSRISKGPGIRTVISHSETKVMTHYLRYHHDGILIGSGTALADNPGLNCRWWPQDGKFNLDHSPRPIILDLEQRWQYHGSKLWSLCEAGEGKPPIIVVRGSPREPDSGASYLVFDESVQRLDWKVLMSRLFSEFCLRSIMIEGGATVINEVLLREDLVDSLIITIGSTFLGKNGVEVSPPRPVALTDVSWWTGTRDAVMCARVR